MYKICLGTYLDAIEETNVLFATSQASWQIVRIEHVHAEIDLESFYALAKLQEHAT
jgi:hypothetical protein